MLGLEEEIKTPVTRTRPPTLATLYAETHTSRRLRGGSGKKGHSWHDDLHPFIVAKVRSLIIMCNLW